MKTGYRNIGYVFVVLGLILSITLIYQAVIGNYNYNKDYGSYWSLADKSSTLSAKSEYISKFIEQINSNRDKFANYNAIYLKTNDNSFNYNLQAVNTLKDRLENISKMDETSFAYQTAIQQITAQEQGEATHLLEVIKGSYFLQNYSLVWDWIGVILIFVDLLVFWGAGFIMIVYYYSEIKPYLKNKEEEITWQR